MIRFEIEGKSPLSSENASIKFDGKESLPGLGIQGVSIDCSVDEAAKIDLECIALEPLEIVAEDPTVEIILEGENRKYKLVEADENHN